MTIKTLSFIHDLLVEEERKALRVSDWLYEIYAKARDDFEDGKIPESEVNPKEKEYETARSYHGKAYEALREFEAKEW